MEYNKNGNNKNYNIATNFSNKDQSWHVHCLDCKMDLWPITFNNGLILPLFENSSNKARKNLHWLSTFSKFDTDIYHSAKFRFCHGKFVVMDNLLHQLTLAIVDLLDKQ